jgi:putative membrane protein
MRITITVAITTSLLAGCALIQRAMPGVALSDSNVIGVLNSIGEGEVEAANLARNKAVTSEIQAFAGRLLNEHRQLEHDQAQLSQRLHLESQKPTPLASMLTTAHDKVMKDLNEKSGLDFDRAYLRYEIARHVRAINLVEAAAESEDNPGLRQQLIRTGPEFLSHLSAARALERQLAAKHSEDP